MYRIQVTICCSIKSICFVGFIGLGNANSHFRFNAIASEIRRLVIEIGFSHPSWNNQSSSWHFLFVWSLPSQPITMISATESLLESAVLLPESWRSKMIQQQMFILVQYLILLFGEFMHTCSPPKNTISWPPPIATQRRANDCCPSDNADLMKAMRLLRAMSWKINLMPKQHVSDMFRLQRCNAFCCTEKECCHNFTMDKHRWFRYIILQQQQLWTATPMQAETKVHSLSSLVKLHRGALCNNTVTWHDMREESNIELT